MPNPGDPVLVDLANVTLVLAAEVGVIIQSSDRDVTSKLKEVMDASLARVIGYVFWDFVANISFTAILNGTTGLAAAAPGVAITMANQFGVGTAGNGVASGGIYCKDLKISHQGEDLRMITGNAFQRAGVA